MPVSEKWGRRVLRERKALPGHKAYKVKLGRKALKAPKGSKAYPAHKERKGKLGHKAHRGNGEYRGHEAREERRRPRATPGLRGRRGRKVRGAHKGRKVLKGQLARPGPGASADFADLVASVQDSVVKIKDPEFTQWTIGTGFFVAPSCSIVTTRHILEERDSDTLLSNLIVELQDGQVVRVTVSYDLKAKDLIVLRPTRSLECRELPLSDDEVQLGQLVLVLGFPDFVSGEDSLSIATGHVVNVQGGGAADFFLTGTTYYGNSGSPILNTQGEVVGMLGGRWGFESDEDNNRIFTYSPLLYGYDVAKHLQ